jgi:hypothetical protein
VCLLCRFTLLAKLVQNLVIWECKASVALAVREVAVQLKKELFFYEKCGKCVSFVLSCQYASGRLM